MGRESSREGERHWRSQCRRWVCGVPSSGLAVLICEPEVRLGRLLPVGEGTLLEILRGGG